MENNRAIIAEISEDIGSVSTVLFVSEGKTEFKSLWTQFVLAEGEEPVKGSTQAELAGMLDNLHAFQ